MIELDPQQIQSLLSKIAKKNIAAFDQLYTHYHAPLHAFILSEGVHNEMAEEALNDAFMTVWDKSDTYKGNDDATFYTWLCAVAKNRIRDLLRKEAKHAHKFQDSVNNSNAPDSIDQEKSTLDKAFSWDSLKHYEETERNQIMSTCISKLPRRFRAISYQVYYQDKGYKQISREQNLPEGTVKSRMSSARMKIKSCVSKAYSGISLWREQ